MTFNSYSFVLFFVLVLALHYSPFSWKIKKFNLLWASYLFYAAWNPPYVILIWISTIVDWLIAKRIHLSRNVATRRTWLIGSLSVNFGLLGSFKYSQFLLDNFINIANYFGIRYQPLELDIILPIGISFYTFQTLSYTIDIYRGHMKPWNSFLDYALYVTFFPQLVAGPIVRAAYFLPQCISPGRVEPRQIGWGISLILIGLFQKTVIADSLLAPYVEHVYDSTGEPSFVVGWAAAFAFAGQILADFSGYSTIAIGVGMCLGFKLPDNFRSPYAAIGFSDFWRRWHISLSSWLRDYLYIGLGGGRRTALRNAFNLMVTMLLGGLWHGASWTFVVWGGLHGSFLVLERVIRNTVIARSLGQFEISKPILALATFVAVTFAWTFFRAPDFERAITLSKSMIGLGPLLATVSLLQIDIMIIGVTVGSIFLMHWTLRDSSIETIAGRIPWILRAGLLGLMALAIATTPGPDRAFIYFQF